MRDRIVSRLKPFIERLRQLGIRIRNKQEYKMNQERFILLSEFVNEGERAESIKYFVDEFLADVQEKMLFGLQSGDRNIEDLRQRYIATLALADFINKTIMTATEARCRILKDKGENK